ncbi:hypothetical protein ACHAXT_011551 [Thalassiosira profunda]
MEDIHNRSRNRKGGPPRWKQNQNAPQKWPAKKGAPKKNQELSDANADHESLTAQLGALCASRNLIESPAGIQKRRRVMRDLESMLSAWSDSLLPKGSSTSAATSYAAIVKPPAADEAAAPCLLSFGSYRLGVHTPDADVDCLVLAPPHVNRNNFFSSWVDVLRKEERVSELHPVPSAFTPVIKFEMDSIKIDLIFARVGSSRWLSEQRLAQNVASKTADSDGELKETVEMRVDDTVLIGLDETSVRSVNGVRVAQFLLDMLDEDATRIENFRLTLRAVKEWARVHGLYANVLGFLGGVNWAILVCWVCKRNPNAPPSKLLLLFFRTFAQWRWPQPVLLSKATQPTGVQPLPVWDPKTNFRDAKHLMPIITPCYPPMNSSYNVGEPQIRRLRDELWRASKLCDDICSGTKEWEVLFEGNEFFTQHANYLQVNIIGSNEDEFRAWFGLCEARLRLLVVGLESPATRSYPFAKFFHRRDEEDKYVASFFIALRFAQSAKRVDLGPLCMEYLSVVNSYEGRKGGMDLTMQLVAKKDLPSFVFGEEGAPNSASEEAEATDEKAKDAKTPAPLSGRKKALEETDPSPSADLSPLKRTRIS